ncbi:MAG: hypothetical protein Q8N98_01110 [bacterium]|nr:hypothetical protein [bacterium]
MADIKLELNKRYLIMEKTGLIKGLFEATVEEIAPSGKWFKLKKDGGFNFWVEEAEIVVLEELK